MNRSTFGWTMAVTAILVMTACPALAAQRGGSAAPKVNPGHAAASPKPAVVQGGRAPATAHGSAGTKTKITTKSTQGQAGARAAAKPVKTTMTKTTTSKTTKTASPKTKSTTTSKTASSKTKSTTTTPTSGGTTTTLSPVQQKLQRNTNLAAKLQSRLPAGTDLTAAAAGFRNLGQFVAAVNVSNNLGIKFNDLKTRMVDQKMSLGQAIQDVRGGSDMQPTALRAEQEADQEIRATSPVTKTTTAAKAPGKPSAKVRKTGATR